MTATAHLLAAMVGLLAALLFILAERRRAYVSQILIVACLGAMVIELASFSFRPSAFLYIFIGGAGRFWFSLAIARHALFTLSNAGILVAAAVALVIYATSRRSRYFAGQHVALAMLLALLPLYTTQVFSAPWFWALPFLFTFIGGVFADALQPVGHSSLVIARYSSCSPSASFLPRRVCAGRRSAGYVDILSQRTQL